MVKKKVVLVTSRDLEVGDVFEIHSEHRKVLFPKQWIVLEVSENEYHWKCIKGCDPTSNDAGWSPRSSTMRFSLLWKGGLAPW